MKLSKRVLDELKDANPTKTEIESTIKTLRFVIMVYDTLPWYSRMMAFLIRDLLLHLCDVLAEIADEGNTK
jgi:hypothetical protein